MTRKPEYLEEKTDVKAPTDKESSDLQNKVGFPSYTLPKSKFVRQKETQATNRKGTRDMKTPFTREISHQLKHGGKRPT